MVSIMIILIR